ncbi:MAG TPA: 4-hydroxybenzoate octaprenyltransferase [Thermoplasmata archaeon]|nr:4-hydroxybenzoate octaprenyltransferase [Thermoplasmata archaeon]
MTAPAPTEGAAKSLGRFLEIQTLGLNLSFALAFLLLASNGRPSGWTLLWVVVAFVAARNAGHSFNRWADRRLDAANPRTQQRALVTGRYSPAFALVFCAANSALLVVAAYLLNPLAFVLAPVALVIVLGYSYTKRVTTFTTAFLGLVQAITPAAVYIAVTGSLPLEVLIAVAALLAWGTAFETIHSLGDVESDRALGLFSVPVRWGVPASVRLVPALHATALALFVAFGLALHLTTAYFVAIVAIGLLIVVTDRDLAKNPTAARVPFERHFAMSLFYLAGVALAVFVPLGPAWVL